MLGTAMVFGASAHASEFQVLDLASGYQVAAAGDGKMAEGSCGENMDAMMKDANKDGKLSMSIRRIKHWLGQYATFGQQKGDQQSPDPTIAIEEGMNGFELCMGQPDFGQHGQRIVQVQKAFQLRHGSRHLMRWWWNKHGIIQPAACCSNPVLGSTKFPRRRMLPSHALHQLFVYFPNQTHGDRQFRQSP